MYTNIMKDVEKVDNDYKINNLQPNNKTQTASKNQDSKGQDSKIQDSKIKSTIDDYYPALKFANIEEMLPTPTTLTCCNGCSTSVAIFYFKIDVTPGYLYVCPTCLTSRCFKCKLCRNTLSKLEVKNCWRYHYDYCKKCIDIGGENIWNFLFDKRIIPHCAILDANHCTQSIIQCISSFCFQLQVVCQTENCRYRARWFIVAVNVDLFIQQFICNPCLIRKLVKCVDCKTFVKFEDLSDLPLVGELKARCSNCITKSMKHLVT